MIVLSLLSPDVRSVLVVRLRVGLGDLLCSGPALRALKAARPDLHLAVATWPETAGVLARMPEVDELVAFPGADGIPERTPDGTLPAWLAAQRRRGWDLALQLYGDNPAANAVSEAVGARWAGGFAPTGYAADPALHVRYPRERHEVVRHLLALEHLGLPAGAPRALHWPLTAASPVSGAYAVLHPGATSASRRWPPSRFALVAEGLAADGLQVVVGGVPSEAATTAAVVAACRAPVLDLTGRTTLDEYAALLAGAAVVVANDTGTAHLTAAVGGRCVTVFLAGDEVRWSHPGNPVVKADVGCRPCPHLTCPIDFRCATRLPASRVLHAARVIAGRPPTPAGTSAPR